MSDNINFDYKNLSPFKWFVLENFPFIEADFDALTEWQLFCKLGKEINKIINSQNIVGEQAETLTNAFNTLKNYVDNYFNNLDVQDEINNKLNEMVEDGTLQEIISDYLNSKAVFGFDTVEDMKNASNLIDGSYAKTMGYYTINDGGNALYKIRTITNEDIVDNGSIIPIYNTNLIAELIIENFVNIKKFGAKGDGITDDTEYIEKALNYCVKNNKVLIIDIGTFIVSNINIEHEKTYIKGISPEKSILKKKNNSDNIISVININSNGFNKTKIESLTVDGNKYYNNSYGILVDNNIPNYNNNFTLKNLYVNNCGLDGINIVPDKITNNVATELINIRTIGNEKNGINIKGTDLLLQNIISFLNKECGIKAICNSSKFSNIKCYRNGDGDGITVENDRKDPRATGTYYKKYAGIELNSNNSTFSQIDCQENEGDGIYATGYNNDFNALNLDNNGYLQDGELNPISYESKNLYPIYDGLHIINSNMIKVDIIYNNFRFNSVGSQQRSAIGLDNCNYITGQIQGGNQVTPITKTNTNKCNIKNNTYYTGDELPLTKITLPENVSLDNSSYIRKIGQFIIMHLVVKKSDNFSKSADTTLQLQDAEFYTNKTRFCQAILSDNNGWNSNGWTNINNLPNGQIVIKTPSVTANYATIDTIYVGP